MTTFNAAVEDLSFSALSQKVIAFGGFVERMPGGKMMRDFPSFIERNSDQTHEIRETESVSDIAQKSYDQGFAEGFAKAEAAMRDKFTEMQNLLAAADALQIEPTAEIAQLVCDLVERIVTPICETMPVTREWLLKKIESAMPHIAACSGAQTLWLNPKDAELLQGVDLKIDLQTDPTMPRATLQIRSSIGYLETGVSPFIQQIHDALDLSEVE